MELYQKKAEPVIEPVVEKENKNNWWISFILGRGDEEVVREQLPKPKKRWWTSLIWGGGDEEIVQE